MAKSGKGLLVMKFSGLGNYSLNESVLVRIVVSKIKFGILLVFCEKF